MSDTALDYLLSGFLRTTYYRPENSPFPDNINELVSDFSTKYGLTINSEISEWLVKRGAEIGLYVLDHDKYAGITIIGSQKSYDSAYRHVINTYPDEVIARGFANGSNWFERVFNNPQFVEDLTHEFSRGDLYQITDVSPVIPASDRVVTLLHNSPEGRELRSSLDLIESDLDTNNEVAEEAGEERERLLAEVRAAKAVTWSDRIRLDVLRSLVLRVFKELAEKLQSKALGWGLEKIIVLLEKILDGF